MTYHRTCGKGGSRNSVRERHADRFLPNYNKSQGSGKIARGRRVDNPPPKQRDFWDAQVEAAGDAILNVMRPRQVEPPRGFKSRRWKGGTKLGDVRKYNMR